MQSGNSQKKLKFNLLKLSTSLKIEEMQIKASWDTIFHHLIFFNMWFWYFYFENKKNCNW